MRATVQSGSPVTGITLLRLKVRMPDTVLASVLAMNVGSQCAVTVAPVSQAVPTWNPQTISTPNAEMRPLQGFFRGHRCTGFWKTLVFQSAHPSGSQRKSRTRGKGRHRRHFLKTRGHYYDNGQTPWSLRGAGNGLAR